MFFIFWGEKARYDTHGVVGDVCPVCERIRAFTVYDYFTASHVYYISLSGWSFQARVKRCWSCATEFHARLKDYDGFVDEEIAQDLSLRDIVERTNVPLADWMADNSQSGTPSVRERKQRSSIRSGNQEGDADD